MIKTQGTPVKEKNSNGGQAKTPATEKPESRNDISPQQLIISQPQRILSVWDFEKLCRKSLANNYRLATLPIQLVIEASMSNSWISLTATTRNDLGRECDFVEVKRSLDWLVRLGLIEYRKIRRRDGRFDNQMRTTSSIDTVEIDSVDGEAMMKIREQLRCYSLAHTSATPLVGLVLSALHVRRMRVAREIGRFVFMWRERSKPNGIESILGRLAEQDIVQVFLGASGKRGGTTVCTIEKRRYK